MDKRTPPSHPEAYVTSLEGWRRTLVEDLRTAVLAAVTVVEVVKWGHLVYLANGPVTLIRAETDRVLFGFWRGKRLREIEPRLIPGGKYEMATIELKEGDSIDAATVRRLALEAVSLNQRLGNPTKIDRVG